METWLDIQGCAFWSNKDSEWGVNGISNWQFLMATWFRQDSE